MWIGNQQAQREHQRAYANEQRLRRYRLDRLIADVQDSAAKHGIEGDAIIIRGRGIQPEVKFTFGDRGCTLLEWWPNAGGQWHCPLTRESGVSKDVEAVVEMACAVRSDGVLAA